MTLEDLGYNEKLAQTRKELNLENFGMGRVVAEHKERYIVRTATAEYEAEITGNMRFIAKGREDFPAVGDWVALIDYDPDFAIIHKILPRYSVLERQAVGQSGEVQIIAANIDYALLVQAVDRDFNINRLERYLTICHSSRVNPIIVLTKTDLISEGQLIEIVESIKIRVKDVKVLTTSSVTQSGYDELTNCIEKGKSYCLLGSSGVGKSTLLNNLSGNTIMKTGSISMSTQKGRHVTTHRELFILDSGGILIDNPGMREVGITDVEEGLNITFDRIVNISQNCKFQDCRHVDEIGCSVLAALENGEIDRSSYENYLKMLKEKIYFETTVEEKRKKEKRFGKILKDYKKGNYKNKF